MMEKNFFERIRDVLLGFKEPKDIGISDMDMDCLKRENPKLFPWLTMPMMGKYAFVMPVSELFFENGAQGPEPHLLSHEEGFARYVVFVWKPNTKEFKPLHVLFKTLHEAQKVAFQNHISMCWNRAKFPHVPVPSPELCDDIFYTDQNVEAFKEDLAETVLSFCEKGKGKVTPSQSWMIQFGMKKRRYKARLQKLEEEQKNEQRDIDYVS